MPDGKKYIISGGIHPDVLSTLRKNGHIVVTYKLGRIRDTELGQAAAEFWRGSAYLNSANLYEIDPQSFDQLSGQLMLNAPQLTAANHEIRPVKCQAKPDSHHITRVKDPQTIPAS